MLRINDFLSSPLGQFVSETLLTALPAGIAIWVAWTGVKTFRQKTKADEENERWRQRDQWLANMRWAVEQTQGKSLEQQRFGWNYLSILLDEAKRERSVIAESGEDWLTDVAGMVRTYMDLAKGEGPESLDVEIEAKKQALRKLEARNTEPSGDERSTDNESD